MILVRNPEGPSSQYLRTLVPNTIKGMVFGTRILKDGVLGLSGATMLRQPSQSLVETAMLSSLDAAITGSGYSKPWEFLKIRAN